MSNPDWLWPNGKRIAVVFNVCLEAWSDGKAPGISPMGNPLPAGVLDTMAISWAAYGVKTGIYRLLDAFERQGAKTSVMVNAVVAERAPDAVKAVADGGHEVLSHSYAMDVIPALLSDEEERKNIERCTRLLEQASGQPIRGWLSPRGTSRKETPRLLADAGYRWYGDVFDTDLPYVQRFGDKKIVAIPLSYDVNDMPSMKYGNAPKMMLDAFEEVIAIARERDDELRIIDVTSHAHIFGHHRGAYYYEKIIEKAVSANDIWIGTRAQIADHVLSQQGLDRQPMRCCHSGAERIVRSETRDRRLLASAGESGNAGSPLRGAPRMTIGSVETHSPCPRSAAAFRVWKPVPRSPAAPNTCTTCACPACCTARSSAARSRMAASAHRHRARRGRSRACTRRHRRGHPHAHPRSLLRAGVPRSADPRARQGALCRRAGRGRARVRSACRRARACS